jgi:hypothetical protein
MKPAEYAKMISLPAIGEATAGFILEEPLLHQAELNLHPLCRPLHSAPDVLMYYRANPGRLALAEVKASETLPANDAAIRALAGALPVFTAWRNSGNAIDAIGVGVSVDGTTSSSGPILNVTVIKLLDPQGAVAAPYPAGAANSVSALWAGDIEAGSAGLQTLQAALKQSGAPPDQIALIGRMHREADERRTVSGFREESQGMRRGELAVSDRIEMRSYPINDEVADLDSVASVLQHASVLVTQRRRRSIVLITEGVEVHVFWDGRVRIVARTDQEDQAASVTSRIQKTVREQLKKSRSPKRPTQQ